MTRTIRTDWAILRADGVIVHTFGDRDLAESWFEEHDGWSKGMQIAKLRLTKEAVHTPARPCRKPVDFTVPESLGVAA